MDELLDSMYARAIAKFKASDTGNLLGATNLTTVQLDALSRATVETTSAGTPININPLRNTVGLILIPVYNSGEAIQPQCNK